MNINKDGIRQITKLAGEPVTIRFAGKGDIAAVRDHCLKALNAGRYLCFEGPNEGEATIFAMPEGGQS